MTFSLFPLLVSLAAVGQAPESAADPIRALQVDAIDTMEQKRSRAYHFGSQGAGGVFSNHQSHSNRLIPVYVFGRKADLGAVTGKNSVYRDEARLRKLYGRLPDHTVNPDAEYADQSDMHRVQREAVGRGAKYLFTVWFDGMDWQTTQAAAIAKSGKVYTEGKGSGLVFQDYRADGTAQYGYFVTSPTRDKTKRDADKQTVSDVAGTLYGGYDAGIAGPNPWSPGPLSEQAPGYLRGQGADKAERKAIDDLGRTSHAVTDSAPSAAEYADGVKSFNDGLNVADDGRIVPTLFHELQAKGWKVGTATSVPFNHASPAAMYARNVERDDYQDIARDMLGLPSIVPKTGKGEALPGLDVVIGAGHGQVATEANLKSGGGNSVAGNAFITEADLNAVQVENGGKYVLAQTTPGANGAKTLRAAADRAVGEGRRLFGFYGTTTNHLPYRTADGGYDPAKGIKGVLESYSKADRDENPTLADMTRAALTVLAAKPGQPFALFVEAGDVDFALHDNNLDNAIGAVHSGEAAIEVIIDWVERNSNWDESVLIVTSDHGHYLVIDDPKALAARPASARRP